jgi:hypothetical protein
MVIPFDHFLLFLDSEIRIPSARNPTMNQLKYVHKDIVVDNIIIIFGLPDVTSSVSFTYKSNMHVHSFLAFADIDTASIMP